MPPIAPTKINVPAVSPKIDNASMISLSRHTVQTDRMGDEDQGHRE